MSFGRDIAAGVAQQLALAVFLVLAVFALVLAVAPWLA